jgi:hypothetical protein
MGAFGGAVEPGIVSHVPEDKFGEYQGQKTRILGQYDPNTDRINTFNKGDFRSVKAHEFQHRGLGKYGLNEAGNQLLDLYLARQIDPAEDVISSKIAESMQVLQDMLQMEQEKEKKGFFEELVTPPDDNSDIVYLVSGINRVGDELMQKGMPLRQRWKKWNSQRSQ